MVKKSPTPLSLQFALIPFRAVDSVSEGIGSRVVTWWKYILVGCGGFFLTYLIYHNPPVTLGLVLYWIALFFIRSLIWFISWINIQFVVAVTVVYGGAILHYVYGPRPIPKEPESAPPSVSQFTKQEKTVDAKDGKDVGAGEGPSYVLNLQTQNAESQERFLLRTLSVITWFLWFSYFCRLLPYPLLFLVYLSVFTGTVIYIRKRPIVPSFTTKYTAVLFGLTGGRLSTNSSRGVSRKGSVQQFSKSRRNTQLTGTPSPGGIIQLREAASETPISRSGGEILSDTGSELLPGIKKLRPPLDLKIEQNTTPYTSSADMPGIYPEDSLASPIASTFGNESEDEVDGLLDSNKFLYGVLCACMVVQVWNHLWLVHLLPIPVVYYGVKRMCISFGLKDCIETAVYKPFIEFYFAENGPSRK